MVYDKDIQGKFVTLRSITEDDAEFSYDIRSRDGIKETVGQLAESIEAQKAYIKKQMNTPGDYYFVIINRFGERVGLIGIYDIHDGIGEIGRFVCVGEPTETFEAELLLGDFIREELKLEKICYVIYAENKKHISDKKKVGISSNKVIRRGGKDALYFEEKVDYTNVEDNKICKMINKLAKKLNV